MAESDTLPVVRGTPAELEAILLDELEPVEVSTDPEAMSREILTQILGAESDEAMLAVGQATPWQELLGIPVELHGFNWRPSTYDQGAKIFLIVRAVRLDNGEHVILTTGGKNVIAQLLNLEKRDRYPSTWKLVQSEKPTANGFHPLWLEAVKGKEPK